MSSLAGPGSQIIAAPYLVSHLGKEAYGVLLLVNSIVAMSGLSSFGLGDATVRYVAEYSAQKRPDEIVKLLQTTLLVYLTLGTSTVLGLNLFAEYVVRVFFNVSSGLRLEAVATLRLAAISLLLRLVYSVGESLCRGLRRHDVESSTAVLGSFLSPLANCLLVFSGFGLSRVAFGGIAVLCLSNGILGWRASKLLGTARWLIPAFRKDNFHKLISYGVFGWFQMVESVLMSQADRMVISSHLGAAAVTPYALCVQLTQLSIGVVSQAFSYLFPMATELHVQNRKADLRALFLDGMRLTTVASFAIAALIFVYGQTVLFIWMGNSLGDYPHRMVLILATAAAATGTTLVPCFLLNGAGYVRLNSIFAMSSAAAVFPASLVLVRFFGASGVAGARLLNVFPGLIARIIIGRLLLDDRRILICFWHLFPTAGGLTLLWAAEEVLQVSSHVRDNPFVALGTVLAAIAATTILAVKIFKPSPPEILPGEAIPAVA